MHRPARYALALLLVSVHATAFAQTGGDHPPEFRPRVRPELNVRRAPGLIEIDGELDDAGWLDAAKATGFSESFPVERGEPPVESEAWLTYDDEYLYVALVAFDDPTAIRRSIVDRDDMWSDDYFGILLDTYGDAAWAYFLFANPYGVQGDSRFATAGGEDDDFDLVYHTEARITDRGYQIEMAIPFESLRFPNRPEQQWRVTFWRTRPRESRATYSWAALDRDEECFLCQFGTLRGIEGVEPGGSIELLPSVVASHASTLADPSDPDSGLDDTDGNAEAALNLRYAHPSGVTAEATFNPDFSQVESDVDQVDVNTTFALFFPERRPFFIEGSDLFDTFFDVLFTRQINDPDAAVKSIVRKGRTSVAYLGARDANTPILLPFQERSFVGSAGESVSNVVRARRTYGSNSYVGGIVTDRRFESGGGSGTTFGADGVHRFLDKYRLEYQLLGSHTAEPDEAGETASLEGVSFDDGAHTAAFDGESFDGFAQYTSLERSARHWNFDVDYWAASPAFRADNGFETSNDYRRLIVFNEVNFWPEDNPLLDRLTPDFRYSKRWTYDGVSKEQVIQPTLEFTLKTQTFVEFGYEWEDERFRDVDFDGMRRWFVFVDSDFSNRLGGGFFLRVGDGIARNLETPAVGDETFLEAFGTIKPIDRLTIEPSIRYNRLLVEGEEIFDGTIFRARTNLNFSRRLFLRLVTQWNGFDDSFDLEPLLTYKINPFTLFFVGSTQTFRSFDEPHDGGLSETSRQFFAKFQYLFRM